MRIDRRPLKRGDATNLYAPAVLSDPAIQAALSVIRSLDTYNGINTSHLVLLSCLARLSLYLHSVINFPDFMLNKE